jgi:hypothetical protein
LGEDGGLVRLQHRGISITIEKRRRERLGKRAEGGRRRMVEVKERWGGSVTSIAQARERSRHKE